MYMNEDKNGSEDLRNLILKLNKSADLTSLNFAFCVDTFIRNFRLTLMNLTLPWNKKPSLLKYLINKFQLLQLLISCFACEICFGVEKNISICPFIHKYNSVKFSDLKLFWTLKYSRFFSKLIDIISHNSKYWFLSKMVF